MDFEATRSGLYEHVVAVPTTIWKGPGELDLEKMQMMTASCMQQQQQQT